MKVIDIDASVALVTEVALAESREQGWRDGFAAAEKAAEAFLRAEAEREDEADQGGYESLEKAKQIAAGALRSFVPNVGPEGHA